MIASLRRVESWTQLVDGAVNGPFWRYIFSPISEATSRYREAKKPYIKKYLDLLQTISATLVKKDINAQSLAIGSAGRLKVQQLILHTGNDSNMQKLLVGRNWGNSRRRR